MTSELYEAGLAVRREVAGAEHVEAALAAADDFDGPMQDFVTSTAGEPSGRDPASTAAAAAS